MRGRTNPAHLYLADRVTEVEATDAFKLAVLKSVPRRESSKIVADKKREILLKQVADMAIKIKQNGSFEDVIKQAIADYNRYHFYDERRVRKICRYCLYIQQSTSDKKEREAV